MRLLIVVAAMLVATIANGEGFAIRMSKPKPAAEVQDPEKFAAYKDRRHERWMGAIETRRELNAAKGPARGWLAIRVNVDPIGQSAIQRGWVKQPPIPRRYTWSDWLVDSLNAIERAAGTDTYHYYPEGTR